MIDVRELLAEWRESALCLNQQPAFDPPTSSSPDEQARIHRALALCGRCPSRGECAEYGVRRKASGVWGGVLLAEGLPVGVGRAAVGGTGGAA